MLCLLAACGDAPSGAVVSDDEVPRWKVEEVVRMGSLDDPRESLTTIGDVRIGSQGELYVAQRSDSEIRVYEADGTLRSRIGRQGEGPGEFGLLAGIGLADDTLYALDFNLSRVSWFGPEGAFLASDVWESRTLPAGETVFRLGVPSLRLSDGGWIVFPGVALMRGRTDPGPDSRTLPMALFRMTRGSPAVDTLFEWEIVSWSNTAPVAGGAAPVRFTCPFQRGPLADGFADGSGVAVVEPPLDPDPGSSTFTVIRLGPTGDTLSLDSIPYEPVPLPGERAAREIEAIRARQVERGQPVPDAGAVEAAFDEIDCLPATLPPVTELEATQDGTMWLRREEVPGDSVRWDAFGAEGERAWVMLPAGETIAAARGELLVTRWTDDLDVPYLTRYRLAR